MGLLFFLNSKHTHTVREREGLERKVDWFDEAVALNLFFFIYVFLCHKLSLLLLKLSKNGRQWGERSDLSEAQGRRRETKALKTLFYLPERRERRKAGSCPCSFS